MQAPRGDSARLEFLVHSPSNATGVGWNSTGKRVVGASSAWVLLGFRAQEHCETALWNESAPVWKRRRAVREIPVQGDQRPAVVRQCPRRRECVAARPSGAHCDRETGGRVVQTPLAGRSGSGGSPGRNHLGHMGNRRSRYGRGGLGVHPRPRWRSPIVVRRHDRGLGDRRRRAGEFPVAHRVRRHHRPGVRPGYGRRVGPQETWKFSGPGG